MKRLYYYQHYSGERLSYLYPVKETKYECIITKSQYNRALKHRTIGGDAGIGFETEKSVVVYTDDLAYRLF